MRKILGVFAAGLAWFSSLISWRSFADPDAFYHAKMSLLFWERGPIRSFPWLDLTTLGTSFADHHFLFHAIEAPFVASLGFANGARVTAVVLAALFLATCYACLKWLGIRHPSLWVLLLALTQPLVVRLLLGKATPLALTFFVFGLAAAWKRKPLFVMIVAILFALSHGGWIFLVGSVGLLTLGEIIHRMVVDEESMLKAIHSSGWHEVFGAIAGVTVGTIVHPNFPENIAFLWIQVVKIGLGTPYAHVILGNEWLPANLSALFSSFASWFILLATGLVGLALTARKPMDRSHARAATSFALPVAVCLALTLKSRRNVEYLAPALFLWIPWIWMMVNHRRLFQIFQEAFSPWMRKIVAGVLVISVGVMLGKGVLEAREALHRGSYPDDVYRDAIRPLVERARPDDRVFHSDWDEFPVLFNIDDRLRYIAGLDPTFLYEASSTLSDQYRDLTWGQTTTTKEQAWDLIHDRLASRFIFIDKRDHAKLLELIKSDNRYTLLAETNDAATFEIMGRVACNVYPVTSEQVRLTINDSRYTLHDP